MENQEFDDQQFPGVTEINEQIEIEEPDEEEMMDYECEEEEEIDESIEEEEEEDEEIAAEDPEPDVVPGQKPTDYPLRCRSIRIGAYKIHPGSNRLHVPVSLAMDSMTFRVPMFVQPYSMVPITIRGHDMAEVMYILAGVFPLYMYVQLKRLEQIKSLLGMSASDAFISMLHQKMKEFIS
ncbi:hypothetical protein CDAR_115001 [Caerostris darwini]|uniref:Uncharacterized protein n=1 Tax=Caerostris darwini TaxID=1538125 RepID=A0AAV4WNW1_9ARAC|nr:hypothetical protein CDAR_115001 [Caerostris darwini]